MQRECRNAPRRGRRSSQRMKCIDLIHIESGCTLVRKWPIRLGLKTDRIKPINQTNLKG